MTPVDELRQLVNEFNDDSEWDDGTLQGYLDRSQGEVNTAAAAVWGVKAGQLSTLVNVSESGSSRSLGDLHKNALAMQKQYASLASAAIVEVSNRPRTRRIVRRDQP